MRRLTVQHDKGKTTFNATSFLVEPDSNLLTVMAGNETVARFAPAAWVAAWDAESVYLEEPS